MNLDWSAVLPVLGVALVLLVAAMVWLKGRKPKAPPAVSDEPVSKAPATLETPKTYVPDIELAPPPPPVKVKPVPVSSGSILADRLTRTRGGILGKIGKLFGKSSGETILDSEWEQLEEALLAGDVGIQTVGKLLEAIKLRLKTDSSQDLRKMLREEGESLMAGMNHGSPTGVLPKPYVISVVGVNGAGKTTTIGKLAQRFTNEGKTVLLGAGDTFRAAAIGQLKVWSDRTGAQFVTGREGADPGAVAFDAVQAGVSRGVDVVLLDTAGRLHTKAPLMEELKKIHRVIKKVMPEAPHEIWLVLDGTAGQNSIAQAKEFQKTLDLTGVVVTKLDGTAKGGAILSVAAELKLPIRFIGVGEAAEDLIPFQARPFLEAILGGS